MHGSCNCGWKFKYRNNSHETNNSIAKQKKFRVLTGGCKTQSVRFLLRKERNNSKMPQAIGVCNVYIV